MKWLLGASFTVILFAFGFYYVDTQIQNTAQSNPKIKSSAPLLAQGKALFVANCASCHGQDAKGVNGAGPPFIHVIYEPNHHGDMSFYAAVQNGVRAHHWPYGNMPPQPQVSADDVGKIVAYIRKLQKQKGIF